MLMPAILEAGYIVLRHAFGINRVLRLTASIDGTRGSEAVGIEAVGDARPRGKDRLAILIRLPLCSRVRGKSPCE